LLNFLGPEAHEWLVNLIDERVAQGTQESHKGDFRSPWLTVKEAAQYLRTTEGGLRKRINRKQLKAHRPEGSRIILHKDDLDAFVTGPQALEVL
jgi:excisionase family DNA binding protein